jgi:hypothetical protein
LLRSKPADLNPSKTKVIAMVKALTGNLPRLERGEEPLVLRCHDGSAP